MEKNVPELRFPGFTGDWKNYKLGELGKARSGVGFPDAEQGGKEGIPFYKVSDMSNIGNEHKMLTANNYVTKEQIARKHWKPINEVPAIFFAKIGAAVFLNRKRLCLEPFLLDNNTMAFSINKTVLDSFFATALFETIDLTRLVQVGALPSYSAKDVENISRCIPLLSEQQKIGFYLQNLDTLITLRQRKVDLLKEFKKGMLQQMLPQKGEAVPHIRFPEFMGKWEKKKLGDISSSFAYGLNAPAKEYDGQHKYIRITDIDDSSHEFIQTYLTSPDTNLLNAERYKLKDGNILFARTGASVGKTYIYHHKDGLVYFAGFLICAKIKGNYDPEFIFQNTLASDYLKFIRITSQRSGQPGVNAQEYAEFELMVPSLPEQRRIGSYFQTLDAFIAAQQRKVDLLKEFKKAMLQKMFI